MLYPFSFNVRLDSAMRAGLLGLARDRGLDAGKLVRQLIARELSAAPDRALEAQEQILFIAIAVEGLLAAHPDPDLRARMVNIWRDRLAEEGHRHAG